MFVLTTRTVFDTNSETAAADLLKSDSVSDLRKRIVFRKGKRASEQN